MSSCCWGLGGPCRVRVSPELRELPGGRLAWVTEPFCPGHRAELDARKRNASRLILALAARP